MSACTVHYTFTLVDISSVFTSWIAFQEHSKRNAIKTRMRSDGSYRCALRVRSQSNCGLKCSPTEPDCRIQVHRRPDGKKLLSKLQRQKPTLSTKKFSRQLRPHRAQSNLQSTSKPDSLNPEWFRSRCYFPVFCVNSLISQLRKILRTRWSVTWVQLGGNRSGRFELSASFSTLADHLLLRTRKYQENESSDFDRKLNRA